MEKITYVIKHMNRELLNLQIQLSNCFANQHIEGVLESIVNYIP